MKTRILSPDQSGITQAAALLARGALVALPTETVYGLGADARDGEAVARIYEAKGRPSFNPLIVHVSSVEMAQEFCIWSDTAAILARAFWPGPLTLVLPLHAGGGLSSLVTAGLTSVALRVPAHSTAHAVLETFGGPVAAPSANPSGRITSTTAAHVLAGLDGRIDAVLDDGPCDVGVESTIVGLAGPAPVLLRSGGVPTEAIDTALGKPLETEVGDNITAPGQMTSHYAPRAPVRLNAPASQAGELLLGFGGMDGDLNLSPAGDLVEAAANLFDHLHQLDALSGDAPRPIAVVPIPETGLGRAINDRLRRAAAPRP